MSDLNHEKSNEEKNSPTLSDMPIHILTRIVNELYFASRSKLQKTCHGFHDFVNLFDSTCENMSFTLNYNESGLFLEWSIDQLNVQYMEHQNGCLVKVKNKEKRKLLSDSDFLEIGLADFKNAIKNPNFKIKNLSIQLVLRRLSFNYPDADHFFNKICETLESLDHKLNVEKLNMHTYNNEKYAYSILKSIKPEKLDEICIGSYFYDKYSNWPKFHLQTNQLTSLEQWKMAKSLKFINLYSDIPIESIFHFDEFAGALKSLSPENIVFLKEVYLQSVTFKQCYFDIKPIYPWTPQNRINIEAVDQLLGPVVPFDQNHPDVRHYPIPNSNQWLLMKITPDLFHIYKTDSPDSYRDPPVLTENRVADKYTTFNGYYFRTIMRHFSDF